MCWFKVCKTSKLPAKGTFFVLFACTKSTKSTPEVCGPLDSGDDSKLCRKWFCKKFQRLLPKPVLPAKRRRKGFESVRKGYLSADARPLFFEKGLLYCKLTVGFCGWNLQLLVSFGVVRSWNFSMLKKAFLYRIALYELKKQPFPHTKRFPFTESITLCPQKPLVFATKTPLVRTTFYCPKKLPFLRAKSRLFAQTFLIPTHNNSFLPSASHFNAP